MKILLAVDGSAVGPAVLRHAAKLAKELKSPPEFVLLHVNLPLPRVVEKEFGKAGPGQYYDKLAEAVLGKLRPVVRRLRLPCIERRAVGEPAATIIAEAKAVKAGMIVMGSHGKGALKSLLIGSVAQKVIASSPLPVLVVR